MNNEKKVRETEEMGLDVDVYVLEMAGSECDCWSVDWRLFISSVALR